MCGIVAIFAYRAAAPAVSETELLTIRDGMRPRGPDGEGLWLSDERRVGLAHRRLAILDLSDAGAQPTPLDDDPLGPRITFNGEIYNYRELRVKLEAQGSRFRSTSDTEVLLHLYRRDGAAMVERSRGISAFVIWAIFLPPWLGQAIRAGSGVRVRDCFSGEAVLNALRYGIAALRMVMSVRMQAWLSARV